MIAGLIFALTFPYLNHAATPQAAVLGGLFPRSGVTVVRVNRAGSYATVLTRGAIMEGSSIQGALLLKRFSFGWQPLALLEYCRFGAGFTARDRAMLMRGMPDAVGRDECAWPSDSGPKIDVEAVRLQMRGPLIPRVVVDGRYALGEWYGGGGGESLFAKRAAGWRLVTSVGGALNVSDLRRFGVPFSTACTFTTFDTICHRRYR